MVLRLWVPLIQRLVARNWKFASSGLPLTASRVANRVGVSTPLSGGRVVVAVIANSSVAASVRTADPWRGPNRRLRSEARRRAFPRPSAQPPADFDDDLPSSRHDSGLRVTGGASRHTSQAGPRAGHRAPAR